MASVKVAILEEFPCTLRPRKARTKFLSRFRLSIVGVSVVLLFLMLFCSNYPSKSSYFLRPSPNAMNPDSSFTVISAFSSSASSDFTNHSLSLEMKIGDKEATVHAQSLVANATRTSGNLDLGILKMEKRNSSDGGAVIVGNFSAENGEIGNLTDRVNVSLSYYSTRLAEKSFSSVDLRSCDIFDGKWVKDDDAKPHYPPGSCPHVDRDFNCFANGRPDDGFVNWRWKPNGCHLPRLNATDFLERLRGKKLVFVGDSLNRNMWESLVCILRHKVRDKKKVYEISGRTEFKKKGIYAFRFEEYNCSVDFVASPFLVRESAHRGRNGTIETLRLDLIDQTSPMYQDADILVFNTGHWWTHEKTSRGEHYYQEGNHVHPKLKALQAYTKALNTWARWIDDHVDTKKTLVFFRGYSITHFRGGQWNSGGQCHKESEPIFKEDYLGKYPSKMRAFEGVMQGMKTPVIYLNISRMTDYRKDGHPSVYRKTYATKKEQIAAESYQDCSHWCLPGVPDAWNELLYVSIMDAQSRAPRKV